MYYVGIDVSKRHHDAVVIDATGQVVIAPFRFLNTRQGVDTFLARLQTLDGQVSIAMEATGHYWLSLYEALTDQGYPVSVFNPFQIKAYRQIGLRKTKTDAVDSRWIADFLRIGRGHPMVIPSPPVRQMRELARFRFTLIQRQANIRRRALTILDRVFPEFLTLFHRPFSPTSRTLLRRAVTAEAFAAWPLEELAQTLRQASRGHFGLETVTAQATVHWPQDLPGHPGPGIHRRGVHRAGLHRPAATREEATEGVYSLGVRSRDRRASGLG